MEIGLGHRYKASVDNLTIAASPSSYDLILFATSATVPMIVDRIVCTANITTGQILRVVLQRRSTASTGGTGVTPTPSSPGSPSASTTVTYLNVSTTGTGSGTPLDSQQWNEFAPYEYNVRPGGDVILPNSYLGLFLPASPASTISASFTAEFIEIK